MSQDLESALKQTLRARAEDASPVPRLAELSQNRAVRLRRHHRTRALAATAAVLAIAVVVPWSISTRGAEQIPSVVTPPTPAPTSSLSPSPDQEVVPEAVRSLASETGALLAVGTTIVDGSKLIPLDPEFLKPFANWSASSDIGVAMWSLTRASGGYVIGFGPGGLGGNLPAQVVAFVDASGRVRTLGHDAIFGGVVVTPDGTLVTFADAAGGANHPHVLVVDLQGHRVHRTAVEQISRPVSADEKGVWLSRQVDPGSPPDRWDWASGAVTPLAVPQSHVLQSARQQQVVLGSVEPDCLSSWDGTNPSYPTLMWKDCDNITQTVIDPTGDRLAANTDRIGRKPTVVDVRDATSGRVLGQLSLKGQGYFDMVWTGDGRALLLHHLSRDGWGLIAVRVTPMGGGVLSLEEQVIPVAQTSVVLGTELMR